ncbi:MAG: leukotriene A4 hydrolase C-terminal domain-containing protein, partial [Pseudomonadota bacterium]|nr:leukotriene A4 hydrolase C-terminal domain-containing protein [Pseudomonadota bacterium]
ILVMPPSFPVGGMENPRLAFVTPTTIAGDRSLVSVIAQEIAHSWSGNLVTQSTWRDLWLTEGLTAYLQSRITEAVDGERQNAMERTLGVRTLRGELARIRPEQQTLAVDLRGRDPGEVLSAIACEKGRLFLTYLDGKFGRARFDAFLRSYFEHFEFQSVTTLQFETYLQTQLLDRFPGIVSPAQARTWIYAPGIPADALLPASEAFATVDAERTRWLEGRPAKTLDTRSWAAQQWIYFLDAMPAALTAAQCKDLDTTFGFTRTTNSEIARSWFTLVIRNLYQPAYARLEDYLQTIGRRRLIVPLYEEMMKTPAGAAQAKRVYALARPGYQSQTVAALDAIVKPQADKGDSLDD